MGVAFFVGAAAAAGRDVERRLTATARLDEGISRSWVGGRVAEAAALKAPKSYVTTQDSQYALASYFANQDSLLLPLTQKGVANGVATLNVSGKVPNAQVPFLGSGTVRGPFGLKTTVVSGGSTDDTPVKIADLYTGITGVTGLLLAFMLVGVQATDGGRPVVEVRVGTSPAVTNYASQTLIAACRGRDYYNSPQVLSVIPVPAVTGMSNTGSFAPNADLQVQAWMYNDGGGTVSIASGQIYSSALFLGRTAI